ncbi:15991_t:CDS:2, partial [Dentiscutata erythropus]
YRDITISTSNKHIEMKLNHGRWMAALLTTMHRRNQLDIISEPTSKTYAKEALEE